MQIKTLHLSTLILLHSTLVLYLLQVVEGCINKALMNQRP